jgi:hypothetical protein
MALASTRVGAHRDLERGENQASLGAIMTAPGMSAGHASFARHLTAARRVGEDARQLRDIARDDWRA